MSQMRTEMFYIRPPTDEEEPGQFVPCSRDAAEGTTVIFTATHPTEMTPVLDADDKPTGKETPQEYGLQVMFETTILDSVSDIPEREMNWVIRALKDTGCLDEET